ncbi:hypothetical protein GCM10009719_25740 [Nocardioides kribbensis]
MTLDGVEFDAGCLSLDGRQFPTQFRGRPISRVDGPPDASRGAAPSHSWRLLSTNAPGEAEAAAFGAPAEDGSGDWWLLHLVRQGESWRGVIGWPEAPRLDPTAVGQLLKLDLLIPRRERAVADLQSATAVLTRYDGGPVSRAELEKTHVLGRVAREADGSGSPVHARVVLSGFGPQLTIDKSGAGHLPVQWLDDIDNLEPGRYEASAELVGYNLQSALVPFEIG